MKIKNVIFDVGGVLLYWNPFELLKTMFDEKKASVLKANMMDSDYWAELDRGTLEIDEAVDIFSKKIPELRDDVEFALKNFIDYIPPIKENIIILNKLSKMNYRLFVLSNFHLESFSKAYEKYSFFKLFEGIVISSCIKMIKPDKKIFEYTLNKYSLTPGETVFFDDSKKNIESASDLGIIGVHTFKTEILQEFYNKRLKKEKPNDL